MMPELRALTVRAEAYLQQNNLIVGHKHIFLCRSYSNEGDTVSSWALIAGINFEYQSLDFDLVQDWLHLKGFEPYLFDQIDYEPDSDEKAAFCEISFYAVPNKIWRSTKFVTDEGLLE